MRGAGIANVMVSNAKQISKVEQIDILYAAPAVPDKNEFNVLPPVSALTVYEVDSAGRPALSEGPIRAETPEDLVPAQLDEVSDAVKSEGPLQTNDHFLIRFAPYLVLAISATLLIALWIYRLNKNGVVKGD